MSRITRATGALAALFLFTGTLGAETVNAEDVKTRVAGRLRSEKKLAELPIAFDVVGSTVTLSGEVETLEQKDKAARIVAKIEGVENVVNRIEVRETTDKDFQVRKRVARELLYYPYYSMFDSVEVGYAGGVAVLGGYVTQPWKKDEMEKRARKVEGVREIQNRIEVLPVSGFDDDLRYTISRLLGRDSRYFDLVERYPAPLHFVVKDARITIEGVVVSEVDHRAIESLVRQGTLALKVTNRLKTDREVREAEEGG